MSRSRTLVIGDVHGCFDELQLLLKAMDYQPKSDELVLVGDLINKGPKSLEVLTWVRNSGAVVTMGNHELKFLRIVKEGTSGGRVLDELRDQMGQKLEAWVTTIQGFHPFWENDHCRVVHAGFAPGHKPAKTPLEWLTTIRTWDGSGQDLNNPSDPPWFEGFETKKPIVFGHWALRGLVDLPHVIGLDTGCVYGRQLSGVILPERRIVQVDALREYCPLG